MAKFPFIKQQDSMQCGITCLQMLCKYYGKNFSLSHLSELCFATTEGVSLLGISDAASKLGLHTLCGRMSLVQIKECSLPCILHWNQNHFVVLYKVKKGKYYIADPSKGLLIYNECEFKDHWISSLERDEECGIAMLLEPTQTFYEMAEFHNNDERRSVRFLMGYIKQYNRFFIQIILGLVVGCGLQLIMPFLTQAIVDIGIKRQNIGIVWLILLGELFIVLGQTSIDFIRRWLLLHISMRINISLVSDFFIKLLKLPMSFFDTKLMGDLLQRKNDHARVEKFLTSQTLNVMFMIINFIVFGVVLLIYNRLIFGIFLAGSLIYAGWIIMFLNKRKTLDYELFEKQAENNNKTYQFITTIQEIKLQDCEQRRRWEWEDVQADLFQVQMKSLKLQQTQEAGSIFINEIKNVIITAMAATAVINNSMTLGMMLAVQYIIGQLNAPVEQFMSFIYSLQDVKISLERINEIHLQKNEEKQQKHHETFDKNKKDIVLNNVTFKYDPHALKNTIENINFTIPDGKVTAIVGTSGSGKTTIIKLLLGFYSVLGGKITIADKNINEYNMKWWRRQCGVVMQDGVIFSESIARNIAVGDDEINTEKLLKAAEISCIKDFVMGLPLKFNTKIGQDGMGLSQGQKQRILIARAVYKNPKFIFFDEATNALDTKNERCIVDNLNEFYKGRTVVIVAHRLSTVKNADQIVVLDDGHIVEFGTHSSLIKTKGKYFNLVKNQLELGL